MNDDRKLPFIICRLSSIIPSVLTASDKKRLLGHFTEFLLAGIVLDVIDDLIVVRLATGAAITMKTIWTAFIIAIPFAVIGELVVDTKIIHKFFSKRRKNTS